MNPSNFPQQTRSLIKRSKYFTLVRLQLSAIGFVLLILRLTTSFSVWRLCGIACLLITTLQLQALVEIAFVSLNAWTTPLFRRPFILLFSKSLICCFSTTSLLWLLTGFYQRTSTLGLFLGIIWTIAWSRKRDLFGAKFLGQSVGIPHISRYAAFRHHVALVIKAMHGMLWMFGVMLIVLVVLLTVVPTLFPYQMSTWIRLAFLCPILTAFWISGFLIFDHVLNSTFDFGNPQEFDHFTKIIDALKSKNQIMMRYGFAHLKWLSMLGGNLGREYRKTLYSRSSIPSIWDVCVDCCCKEIDNMNYIIVQISERIPDHQSYASGTSSVKAWEVAQQITHKQVMLSHCLNALTGFAAAACTEDHKAAAKNGNPSLGSAMAVIFEGYTFLSLFINGNLQSLKKFENIGVLLIDFEMSCSRLWNFFHENLFVQMTQPHYISESFLKRNIELLFQE